MLDSARRDILALVGGYGYPWVASTAASAPRQPGSAFKPFIYAAAIDSKRYTAASMVNDSPEAFKLWKPQNHEKNQFRGPVRDRQSIERFLRHEGLWSEPLGLAGIALPTFLPFSSTRLP